MTGFETELRNKILGTNSHILVKRLAGQIQNWQDVVESIKSVKGVTSVSAFTYSQALIRGQSSSSGLLVRGIQKDSSAATQLASYIDSGSSIDRLFEFANLASNDQAQSLESQVKLPSIIIGKELSRSMGLTVGTAVAILSPNVSSTPLGLVPKFRRFIVAATYSSGLIEYESGLAYIDMSEAQKFFDLNDAVSGIEVRVDKIDKASIIAQEIFQKIGGFSRGFYVQDWTETNKPLWEAIKLEKRVYFIVLLLIIVMASFSIVTALIMIVLEKRKDIAIMKTMGASASSIANIFRIQGATIGIIGTILGTLGGYLTCIALTKYGFPIDERIFQMSTVPVKMEALNFFLIGISGFIISFLATIYPAKRAARLNPVDILRYE